MRQGREGRCVYFGSSEFLVLVMLVLAAGALTRWRRPQNWPWVCREADPIPEPCGPRVCPPVMEGGHAAAELAPPVVPDASVRLA
jgi:hypothetical protein